MSIIGLIFFTIALAVFISSLIIDNHAIREATIKLVKISVVFLVLAVCADIVMAIIFAMIGG